MKTVILSTLEFPPDHGGVSSYYKNICDNLPVKKITVITLPKTNSEIFDSTVSYQIIRKNLLSRYPWIWPKWIKAYRIIKDAIIRNRASYLLVGQILPLGTIAYILKKIKKVPYGVFVHGMDISAVRGRRRELIRLILKNSNWIFTNSHFTKNLVETYGILPEKITTVYPCLSNTYHASDDEIALFRAKHQLFDRKILLTAGRLVERKGVDMILQALPDVLKKHPDALLIIAGDGPYKDALESIIRKLGLYEHVRFFSKPSDEELACLYGICEFFIMPSRMLSNGDVEGFGMVYLEANARGKAVIAGMSGGATEAVINGINGLVVDPLSRHEIANAALRLLDQPHESHRLGMQGLDRLLANFQWRNEVNKIEKKLNRYGKN